MQDFEKKLDEAKKLLEKLNNPDITLYEAMQTYKKGIKLLEEATKMIEEAKLEFEKIK
jgi:exodeoxyribonuclease VII small subunit